MLPTNPLLRFPLDQTVYGTGFVEYNQHPTDFMNLLNQPISWDPDLYGWPSTYNSGGFGSSQNEPDFVPKTQTEIIPERLSHKKKETSDNPVKKIQPWEDGEEVALVRAWIDVSEDAKIDESELYFSNSRIEGSITGNMILYQGNGPILTTNIQDFNRFTNVKETVGKAGKATRI